MASVLLVLVFIASTLIGYKIIKNVPSLLHTPLMSGMNALSGITVLGALTATAFASLSVGKVMGGLAIILAMLNVAGGFGITNRMLSMFHRKER